MKKNAFIPVVLLALVAALAGAALAGCSAANPTPTDVTKQALDALKAQDFESMQKNYAGNAADLDVTDLAGAMSGMNLENLSDEEKALAEQLVNTMTAFDYELGTETIDGDTATVEATISTYDLGSAFSESFEEYLTEALSAAFSGQEMNEEEMTKQFLNLFNEKISAQTEKSYVTTTTFNLTKTDGQWKMDDMSEENVDAIMGGMMSGLMDLAGSLGAMDDAA